MCMFSERTQVLLSPEQLGRLKRVAERERKSVGAVIREAVDAYIDRQPVSRIAAARMINSMELPAEDWEVTKAHILNSQLGDS
jgi:predicted transcriptional regulator